MLARAIDTAIGWTAGCSRTRPRAFNRKDGSWRGVTIEGQVLYELHVGTFTPEGTWRAAAARLSDVKAVGVTVVEVMPVAEFPGRFGWGYDGVFPYAPC